jgi:hypothetical protein
MGPRLLGMDAPLHRRPVEMANLRVVGMFRDPRHRLPAAYKDHLNAPGFPPAVHAQLVQHAHNLHEYASFPGIAGCQTRMLLGMHCADQHNPHLSPHQENEAISRIEEMAYVGLADHWELSVKLFHAVFGGTITQEDLKNLEPEAGAHTGDAIILDTSVDPSDWKVYTAAVHVFVARVKQHLVGVAVPDDLKAIASGGIPSHIQPPKPPHHA